MRFTTKLLPSRIGNCGRLLLNNPKSLHALTTDMVQCMQDVLESWQNDADMTSILIQSSRDDDPTSTKRPAFCAGGDVKAVYEVGQEKEPAAPPQYFFHEEYKLNHTIATSRIPIVAIWDGIVMGGGVGISIHGTHRIATQRTLLAMPETAIGFFPDVGSTYWMTRLIEDRAMRNYIALTGRRLTAQDVMRIGLATHYVPSHRLGEMEAALQQQSETEKVDTILDAFHEDLDTQHCFLSQHEAAIQSSFGEDTVEGIVEKLKEAEQYHSEFETTTLKTLESMSPTSLKVTLEALRRGETEMKSIGECLQMEYRMAVACTKENDFYEGVRSVLVDKDRNPKWVPSQLEDVTQEHVERHFQVPPEGDWEIPAVVHQQDSKL